MDGTPVDRQCLRQSRRIVAMAVRQSYQRRMIGQICSQCTNRRFLDIRAISGYYPSFHPQGVLPRMRTAPAITLITALSLIPVGVGVGAEIFLYKESDGTRWFTDRRVHDREFTLIEIYGRPTATRSCIGMTPQLLDDRASLYLPLIKRQAEKHGVDERLVHAVISVESCFDPNAVSTVGAQGLMQLMPATAKSLGVSNPYNPGENIGGGVAYLKQMITRFKEVRLALAAYNAGPGAVERHGGVPPFAETQSYVARVLDLYEGRSGTPAGLSR